MKTLLIIDVQKGFINENNRQMLKSIENIVGQFDTIIATQFVNNENSQYVKLLNWNAMLEPEETDFAFKLPKETQIIKKTSYGLPDDVFDKQGLMVGKDIVVPKGSEIYLCGTDYDACVLAVAYQLFDNGFAPKIISSCIGSSSRNPIDKKVIEKIMSRNFGRQSIIKDEREI